MAKIVVDGNEYEVNPNNNLLQECLSLGFDLPYFCWHPCMGSVGACRQCAVKQYRDENDEKGTIVMACMTPASDGARISITDEQAHDMRERVIESLMISHPHDCPVCEEGGECHLQDMTLMSGHNYRRYDKKKVTHHNQYLGPFISHEMNRCITCYRCVRFYDDYAGGTDLSAQASHHHTYFGRHEEGTLENEFSGNLVEVCPTGVFTDKVFSQAYTRKWDLQTAPSICTGCSAGCNITPGERYGSLRRVVNRYNSEVNGYFICDRGRFGWEYVNGEERVQSPVQVLDGDSKEMSDEEIDALFSKLADGGVIGIGSPRSSNESNYALRQLVGEANFYPGIADDEHAINQLILKLHKDQAFHSPSVREIEQADAVFIIGEDITNTAPRIALAVRQSVRNKASELAEQNNIPVWQDAAVRELAQQERSPLFILSNAASRLDDVAQQTFIGTCAEQANFAFAVAEALKGGTPAGLTEQQQKLLLEAVEALSNAKRPLIISGSSNGSIEMVQAAANIARALSGDEPSHLALMLPEANTMGLELLVGPEQELGAALKRCASGEVPRMIVLETDLYRRAPTADVDNALSRAETLVVLDQMRNATTAKATHVFPVTAFSEQESTYVNYESRAQLSFQVHQSATDARPGWKWLTSGDADINSIIKDCSDEAEGFGSLDGLVPRLSQFVAGLKIPRQSHRYSGRTAMIANRNVHEPKQPVDNESVMAFSMEGMPAMKDASILGSTWAPSWNSNQSISKFQEEVNGELKQGHTGTLLLTEKTESGVPFQANRGEGVSNSDRLTLSLAFQIFGSEELSARSPAIQKRMTDAYVALAPADAARLEISHGDTVALNGGPVAAACIREKISEGSCVVHCGAQINAHDLAGAVSLTKTSESLPGKGLSGLIVSDLCEESY
ncbi:MAG: NADH-quinone oxidoreductase subunit NuoG [Pseudomonadota bacterium]|nr:NADH-quinone oxidoreductase subunit NuoG [Pseudomonadota bacterium]